LHFLIGFIGEFTEYENIVGRPREPACVLGPAAARRREGRYLAPFGLATLARGFLAHGFSCVSGV
jgi:hypothetical protein